jgi:hypothetical protein
VIRGGNWVGFGLTFWKKLGRAESDQDRVNLHVVFFLDL